MKQRHSKGPALRLIDRLRVLLIAVTSMLKAVWL